MYVGKAGRVGVQEEGRGKRPGGGEGGEEANVYVCVCMCAAERGILAPYPALPYPAIPYIPILPTYLQNLCGQQIKAWPPDPSSV